MHLTPSSPPEIAARFGGNKARGLHRLAAGGLPVPPWVALGTDVFAAFVADAGLERSIVDRMRSFDASQAELLSRAIGDSIVAAPTTERLRRLVAEAVAMLGERPLAVRSSGSEEDSGSASFAGQFETALCVAGVDAVIEQVKRCWASAYSERALLYRHNMGRRADAVEMAVILQAMVEPDASGVLFTADPTSGERDCIVVSSVFGLGEGLVSGAIDADTFYVDRASGVIRARVVGEKREQVVRAPDGSGTTLLEVSTADRARESLSPAQIARLADAAVRIEQLFGFPQDIEWAFEGETLWILQSRPITGVELRSNGAVFLWDNSNIIESFPDVTLPLTFSFARHVYFHVFREYCRLLWIPSRKLREMESFLQDLLGYFNGRVYYNLLHWYRIAGLTPMRDLNRDMMEIGMGVDERLDQAAFKDRIEPYSTRSRGEAALLRTLSWSRFIWFFLRFRRNVAAFRRRFYEIFAELEAIDYATLDATQANALLDRIERDLLWNWGLMVPLEATIGIPFGVLRKMIARWIPDAPPGFENTVIGGIRDLESVEPARRLDELAALVRRDVKLEALLRATPSERIEKALRANGHDELLAACSRYICDFGYRSVNELKLEEPDLTQAPEILFDMLKAALASAGANRDDAAGAAATVDVPLRGLRRWLFDRVRGWVRDALEAREAVRFCRSRAFGIVRRVFLALGEDFARSGILAAPRDIFYLRLEEIRACFDGSLSHLELTALVAERKKNFAAYADMPALPARFLTQGPPYWARNLQRALARVAAPEALNGRRRLTGVPAAPGRAEGLATVAKRPSEFGGGILVAYRTDPGWAPVFASASALLIERGSPLTHAAVVARELGIPTVVQIPGLTAHVTSGMFVRVDGGAGTVDLDVEA